MAEETGADGATEQAIGGETQPQVGIISQYVKDFSFENPSAPAVYQWQVQPQIDVQFNIGSTQVADDVYEVVLKIDVTANTQEGTAFRIDLSYAGLFGLRNVPQEQLQPFLLAEAPRLIFPFARQIIVDATVNGGFPPLPLDPIDFGSVYMQRAAQAQAELGNGQAPEVTGQA
jgi:preprotein translocase subunit SecB